MALGNQNYLNHFKLTTMYTLDCEYYDKEFTTIALLIKDIMETGMDPNYEIMKDDIGIGELANDFIVH
jgi:hypothetical protein